jgi:hypothetical protein
MRNLIDGPASTCFTPLKLNDGITIDEIPVGMVSEKMANVASEAPRGECVAWGISFSIGNIIVVKDSVVSVAVEPVQAEWLVVMHTSDVRPPLPNQYGVISPMHGEGRLNEHAADYVFLYSDGTEERVAIRMRHQVGAFTRRWGENGFECVAAHKPQPVRGAQEQIQADWGWTQTRVDTKDSFAWTNWLWAWHNPHPKKKILGIRFEPISGVIIVSAISTGTVANLPLRWQTRRKAVLHLGDGEVFQPNLDEEGRLPQIQLDMGQIISALPRTMYANDAWEASYNNQLPSQAKQEILVEYTAHPQACFHLGDGRVIPVIEVENAGQDIPLQAVAPASRRLTLKVIEKKSGKLVAVKLHLHGAAGEYLAPVDRHRFINSSWFEDYSVDYSHAGLHSCSYIAGETVVDFPLGKVYAEVSKGFEIRPVRIMLDITPELEEVLIEVERVLPWREKGWVTADTHVHFLSPVSALLEGAGEGVNVVNLLASQWGELMTNVGDFDGKTTWGTAEAGGGPEDNGEYLVRVGTENRQHVLGHISLLGYKGRIIAPMTVGGPDEAALGDPVDVLLTEWARQCKTQGGLVVLPHFPNPRAEHAASLISGDIDAVEMTAWDKLYVGIDPYSLSDWYRYLNCGYLVPAVGGTDKMASGTAVGTVRTYARIASDQPFSYSAWMDAVRRAETFVTYGPLIEFAVEGKPAGSRIAMSAQGGRIDVTWQVASVTIPLTQVDLIVNGEVRESTPVSAESGAGSWQMKVEKSAWVALLVRGRYADKPEMIAAHSSPVFVEVAGSQMMAAADGVTILEQIEGALAYLDTVGTRAEDQVYKRMRMVLVSAHRRLHNRMHQAGAYHDHTIVMDHDGGGHTM